MKLGITEKRVHDLSESLQAERNKVLEAESRILALDQELSKSRATADDLNRELTKSKKAYAEAEVMLDNVKKDGESHRQRIAAEISRAEAAIKEMQSHGESVFEGPQDQSLLKTVATDTF